MNRRRASTSAIKALRGTERFSALNNMEAGVSDVGNNDKIIANTIYGAGYEPATNPAAYAVFIDADPSFTNRPKVHANRE